MHNNTGPPRKAWGSRSVRTKLFHRVKIVAQLLETVPALTPGTGFQIIYFDHVHHFFPHKESVLCHGYWTDQKEETKDARITQVDSVYIMSGKMEVLSVQVSDFDP